MSADGSRRAGVGAGDERRGQCGPARARSLTWRPRRRRPAVARDGRRDRDRRRSRRRFPSPRPRSTSVTPAARSNTTRPRSWRASCANPSASCVRAAWHRTSTITAITLRHVDGRWPFLLHMALPDDVYRVLFGHRLMFHNRLAPARGDGAVRGGGFRSDRGAPLRASRQALRRSKAPRQRAKPVCPPGSRAGVCRGSRPKTVTPPRCTISIASRCDRERARHSGRLLDVVGAAAMLAIASPILAVAAVVIRVTDGAPVFFRQQRLGRGRRPFQIIKLRTMTDGQVTAARCGVAGPRSGRDPSARATCCAARWRWWDLAR